MCYAIPLFEFVIRLCLIGELGNIDLVEMKQYGTMNIE